MIYEKDVFIGDCSVTSGSSQKITRFTLAHVEICSNKQMDKQMTRRLPSVIFPPLKVDSSAYNTPEKPDVTP